MDFKTLIQTRRSVRKFEDRAVEREKIERIMELALQTPSSKNSRSTRFVVVDKPETVHRMASMRDMGSAWLKYAPAAIVVLGKPSLSDQWQINAALAAQVIWQAAIDEGLKGCWVQIEGRPMLSSDPHGKRAEDYLREFLPLPDDCEALCALAIGYSTFEPRPLPAVNQEDRVVYMD